MNDPLKEHRLCVKNGKLKEMYIDTASTLGKGSQSAEAYQGCTKTIQDGTCGNKFDIAIKQIPFQHDKLSDWFISFMEDSKSLEKQDVRLLLTIEEFAEIFIMKLCKELITQKICPNLPVYLDYFICDKCTFKNPNIPVKQQPCIILVSKLETYDLKKWP